MPDDLRIILTTSEAGTHTAILLDDEGYTEISAAGDTPRLALNALLDRIEKRAVK